MSSIRRHGIELIATARANLTPPATRCPREYPPGPRSARACPSRALPPAQPCPREYPPAPCSARACPSRATLSAPPYSREYRESSRKPANVPILGRSAGDRPPRASTRTSRRDLFLSSPEPKKTRGGHTPARQPNNSGSGDPELQRDRRTRETTPL